MGNMLTEPESGHSTLDTSRDEAQDAGELHFLTLLQSTTKTTIEANNLKAPATTLTPDHHGASINALEQIWEWNKTVPAPVRKCIHDIIQESTLAHPDTVAICAWDGELTYCGLDSLATGLAALLTELGVGTGTVVPLCFEKSMWTSVAILGVLKSGAAFCLLDPSQPLSRLQTVTRQLKAEVVVTSPCKTSLASQLASRVVHLDYGMSRDEKSRSPYTAPSFDPSAVAYIAFTSGSTGTPKGAINTHENLASALHYQRDSLKRTADSRVYDFSSYTFDASITNVLFTLAVGGCLCVPSEHDRKNRLAESIADLSANTIDITSSVARLLSPDQVPGIKTLLFGGEPLHLRDVRPWWRRVNVINMYGPCECTPVSTINSSPETMEDALFLGPGAGLVTWIVDPEDHTILVPIGSVGELLLEGPLVGQGYLGESEKTRLAFIEDPPWLLQGSSNHMGRRGRLYKTGDLVQCDGKGNLTFVGRKDTQVKIRGQRIELSEIEHALHACENVSNALALLHRPSGRGERIVAFVTLHNRMPMSRAPLGDGENEQVAQIRLRETLAGCLPSYMVPSVIEVLHEMPLTRNGKIDRQALLNTLDKSLTCEGSDQQPTTKVGVQMRKIWSDVLGLEPRNITLGSSFLNLGGDSMSAMKVVSEAREAGFQLTVADILRHPVLESLVDNIAGECKASKRIDPFALLGGQNVAKGFLEDTFKQYQLQSTFIEDAYPCTPLQEGLIALSLKRPGNYLRQGVLDIGVDISLDRLLTAWEQVVKVMPILRTRVVQHHALGLVQVVLDEGLSLRKAKGLDEYLVEDAASPMELGEPLSRYALISDEAGSPKWFVWTLHHALYDGWSIRLITNGLRRAYSNARPDLGPQFQAFIKYLKGQDAQAVSRYWRQALDSCNNIPFPPLPSAIDQPVADSRVERSIAHPCKVHRGITISALIRAAWGFTISRLTESPDIVFGVTVFGRSAPVLGIDEMIAPAFATVPVRIIVDEERKVSEYLAAVQQQAIEMIPFEQAGLHSIAKISPYARRACLFQTLLLIQPEEDMARDGTLIGTCPRGETGEDFNTYGLNLELQLGGDKINILASFDSRIIERRVVDEVIGQFESVLDQLDKAAPHYLLADIQALSPSKLRESKMRHDIPPAQKEEASSSRNLSELEQTQAHPLDSEQQMMRICEHVLGQDPNTIHLHDNFHQLGGNSIDAMKIASEARRIGLDLTVADIFRNPEMRNLVRRQPRTADSIASNIPKTHSEATEAQQSYLQEGMWLLDQQNPGLTWDLIPAAWRLRGPLRLKSLAAALRGLEERHESLRTVFAVRGGVNLQIVQPFQPRELKVVAISPGDTEMLARSLREDQTTPFDLQKQPGWRVSIYKLGQEDHVLSIVLHHIACDGWSMDVLWRELALFYSAAENNGSCCPKLDPLPVRYVEFSLWQRGRRQSEYPRQLEYWARQLHGSQPAEMPLDKPRPAALSGRVEVEWCKIQGDVYRLLQAFCKRSAVTPFVVLLAAFRTTHFLLTGARDATIGTTNADRSRWELKNLVGLLVNLQCVRTKIEDETFESFVRQVQVTTSESFRNEDVPFDLILSNTGIQRCLSHHPLFQILLSFHSQLDFTKFTLEGIETETIEPVVFSPFDLQLHFYQLSDGLRGEVVFSTDLYHPSTIEEMVVLFLVVLERVLAKPTAALNLLAGLVN